MLRACRVGMGGWGWLAGWLADCRACVQNGPATPAIACCIYLYRSPPELSTHRHPHMNPQAARLPHKSPQINPSHTCASCRAHQFRFKCCGLWCACCCSVVSSLREAGVPCVSPAYLVDWLAQPWLSLEQHYLFGDQAAQSGELQQLEAARGAEGQGQQQSASF